MQVVILVGGEGTRMAGEGQHLPKPMIAIGGRPILWHIMKHYDAFGYRDFILCLGHKGDVIRDYFLNYMSRIGDATINTRTGEVRASSDHVAEDWNVNLVETGEHTGTGGRIKRIERYIVGDSDFLVTYGDSLSDVPIDKVVAYHQSMRLTGTMCVMHSNQRFGHADVVNGRVTNFIEKPKNTTDWINGGFYVFQQNVFSYLEADGSLEYGPLGCLASKRQLAAYEHLGCHRAMDTPRDVKALNEEWEAGNAEWKIW